MFRTTQDADLYCHGNSDPEYLVHCFKEICTADVEDDGVVFDLNSFTTAEIRKEARYHGTRIAFHAYISSARALLQFDVGFGDSIFPAPKVYDYPRLLENFPAPHILVYPQYTVIAEKLDAIITLGMTNSRVKDYFDLWVLTEHFDYDAKLLAEAIHRTFERRGTAMPSELPLGLSNSFASDKIKNSMWKAFIKKIAPPTQPDNLQDAILRIRLLAEPFISNTISDYLFWKAGIGWQK